MCIPNKINKLVGRIGIFHLLKVILVKNCGMVKLHVFKFTYNPNPHQQKYKKALVYCINNA